MLMRWNMDHVRPQHGRTIRTVIGRHVLAMFAGLLIYTAPLHARITRIVIDETVPAFCKGTACTSYGEGGQYEQIAKRAFGELDPNDPRNKLIQDIELARDKDGKVRYVATFVLTKPIDMSRASGMPGPNDC